MEKAIKRFLESVCMSLYLIHCCFYYREGAVKTVHFYLYLYIQMRHQFMVIFGDERQLQCLLSLPEHFTSQQAVQYSISGS